MNQLQQRFKVLRETSEEICRPLEIEDYSIQPIVDVSPPKWHLGHTTWFWEQFLLNPFAENYQIFDPSFAYHFNSYYNHVGTRVIRPNRGLMTRPTVSKVLDYRHFVTEKVVDFLAQNDSPEIVEIVELGINHEEQHQELLAYDIKYILGNQPDFPRYGQRFVLTEQAGKGEFLTHPAGVYEIGFDGHGFCFDNEKARHKVYLNEFQISDTLVTNAEFIEFIEDRGYQRFELWHSDGWDWVNNNQINAPLYWHNVDGEWQRYDLDGFRPAEPNLPVMNVSFYEAFAFAEWKKMRLPTESEWETAADRFDWGQLWEWTGSAYLPYPGFAKAEGAIGEYNGKFMVNQMVLRGASVATPRDHSRKTYRNFFHPHLRWMFSGIRLAK